MKKDSVKKETWKEWEQTCEKLKKYETTLKRVVLTTDKKLLYQAEYNRKITQTAHGLMSVSDKKKLDGIAEGANKTTVDSELSSTSTNPVQNKAVQAELTKKAPIASPSFTGTPKVPTASAGTNNTQAASTAFVTSAISTAMAGITKLDFQVVQTLPSTGVKGTFYLIANSGRGQNVYDEYLWINNKYEKLGTREIDLSSYIKQSDMVAITNSEIDAAFA